MEIENMINDLNLINLNYEQLKQDLTAIEDKNTIQCIDRSNYSLNKLEGNIFDGFYQLIDLDLSNNILTCLPRGVFDQLFNLKTVNISHNLIFELEDSIFKNNKQLRTIDLSNNFINKINNKVLHNLPLLRVLNINYNRIESLLEVYIESESLQKLYLGNNLINNIYQIAFWYLPNLILLHFNNNCISYVDETMFINKEKIENLNFSNNFIKKLKKRTFANLRNLKKVDFSNNLLSTCGNCFENKPKLDELNLLNNLLNNFRIRDFAISKNIRTLKLTIHEPHKLERINNLELLSNFELHVKTEIKFLLNQNVVPWINALTIRRLFMIIQCGIFNISYEISKFFNLEFLHIEFLEPNDLSATFDFGVHINRMPKLQHLALININKLIIISDSNIKDNNLTYLDLTGIENESIDFLQNNFVMLEHLNLSGSQINYISQDLLKTLPNLKSLIMNNTGIFTIRDYLFQFNNKLELINFKNCQIHTIGENSFRNLGNLKLIDIRDNKQLRITESLLNGIPKSATFFYN